MRSVESEPMSNNYLFLVKENAIVWKGEEGVLAFPLQVNTTNSHCK